MIVLSWQESLMHSNVAVAFWQESLWRRSLMWKSHLDKKVFRRRIWCDISALTKKSVTAHSDNIIHATILTKKGDSCIGVSPGLKLIPPPIQRILIFLVKMQYNVIEPPDQDLLHIDMHLLIFHLPIHTLISRGAGQLPNPLLLSTHQFLSHFLLSVKLWSLWI